MRELGYWETKRLVFNPAYVKGEGKSDNIYELFEKLEDQLIGRRIFCLYSTDHVSGDGLNRWSTVVDFGVFESAQSLTKALREYEKGKQFEDVLGWKREWKLVMVDGFIQSWGGYLFSKIRGLS